ncbi:SOUL family heme-binding protein [Halomarina salina]|uniref:SOUL family heme-binding protein n=1 Tax=Halomarina salina TaxID=1872699 RepID=A0ABD5RIU3_9EURY|nr:heme-binding protein [Halomarina salina]
MGRKTGLAVAATLGLLTAWVGWGAYTKRSTERVPFTTVRTVDGVEIREYPALVVVETTAASEPEAFDRLARYLSGANESRTDVSMTAPVRSYAEGRGATGAVTSAATATAATGARRATAPIRLHGMSVATTSPVRSATVGDRVTMGFYLPDSYTGASAPRPTNSQVALRAQPPRRLAVRPFSWWATDDRTRGEERALLSTLAEHDLTPASDPVVFQYDPPLTPPFLRENEVAVELPTTG